MFLCDFQAAEPLDPFEPKRSFKSPVLSKRTQEGKDGWEEETEKCKRNGQQKGKSKQDSGIDMNENSKAQGIKH